MSETATETKVHRGRPRPELTLQRDEKVAEQLRSVDSPQTRNQLAEALQEGQANVYRALCRLRNAGRVARGRADGGGHVWSLTGTNGQG
jgi:hypothetical protein